MDNEIIDRICTRSFALAIIGVCIVGICPAFSIMPLATSAVLRSKGVELTELNRDKIKKGNILAVAGLVMFVADIVIASLVYGHFA
jgi:hypothetical protein